MVQGRKKTTVCSALLLAAALICTSCAPAGVPSGEGASGVSPDIVISTEKEPESTPEAPKEKTPEALASSGETRTAEGEASSAAAGTDAPPETRESVQTVSRYKIGEGTTEENEVVKIVSENPGPTVYIVGGIHGDELAGWNTANYLV